jgi:hypothetical protein
LIVADGCAVSSATIIDKGTEMRVDECGVRDMEEQMKSAGDNALFGLFRSL